MSDENDDSGLLDLTNDDTSPSLDLDDSGSGLLDLCRENDDTSLGIRLLDDVYSPDLGVLSPIQVDEDYDDAPFGTGWWFGMLMILLSVGVVVAIIAVLVHVFH